MLRILIELLRLITISSFVLLIILLITNCSTITYDNDNNTFRKHTSCVDILYYHYTTQTPALAIDWYQGHMMYPYNGSFRVEGFIYDIEYVGPYEGKEILQSRGCNNVLDNGIYLLSFKTDCMVFGYSSGSYVSVKQNTIIRSKIPEKALPFPKDF